MTKSPTLAAIAVWLGCFAVQCAAANNYLIHVLVPRFSGDPKIGASVATVLDRQLWRSLQQSPSVKGFTFTSKISWSPDTLPEQKHAAAELVAQKDGIEVQMVLWGEAWPFANGVIAQTYLSIPYYEDLQRPIWLERWSVTLKIEGRSFDLEPDIPTRRYEFPPMALRPDVLSQFKAVGDLQLYHDRELKQPWRKLDLSQASVIDHGENETKIKLSTGEAGWIKVPKWVKNPEISQKPSHIIDFVSGIIRIFRGDYNGAQELLRPISKAEDATQQLKIDSLLYLALAADKLGKDPLGYTTAALELNPYSAPAAIYHLTAQCSVFSKRAHPTPEEKAAFIANLKSGIEQYGYLLPPEDPTLRAMKAIVAL